MNKFVTLAIIYSFAIPVFPYNGFAYTIEQYLSIRGNSVAGLSPDDEDFYYYDSITGVRQAYRLSLEGGFPQQVTYFEEGIEGITIHPVEDIIAITADTGGNERYQVYLADSWGANPELITPGGDTINYFGGFSRDGRWMLYKSNVRNEAYFDIYLYDLKSGISELIVQDDSYQAISGFSPDGRYVGFLRYYDSKNSDIFLYDRVKGGDPILVTPHEGDAEYGGLEWLVGSSGFYFASNEGREFIGLAFYDVTKSDWEWSETPDWDIEDYGVSYSGKYLFYEVNADAIDELVVKDLNSGEYIEPPPMNIGQYSSESFTKDDKTMVFTHNNTINPTSVYRWDINSDTVTRLTYPFLSGIDSKSFVPSERVYYESFDGLEIPTFIYKPVGLRPGEKTPVIVHAHGGPEAQAQAWFSAIFQYYLDKGYGVAIPNIRGSSGYGLEYARADNIRKRPDAVKDMEYLVRWLEDQPWADTDKLVITGGSYGGYMVLACLTEQPDLWAAGVCSIGIANFVTFLNNTGVWRRPLRESEYGYLDEDYDFLVEISPLTNAHKIRAPLMVIHGANDPRVPVSEAEQIVEAARDNGVPVMYLLYDDEGHGITKLKNRLDAYPKQMEFLGGVLGDD
jgi:dipeptidyl aminopeptidase/acylaminoacyl peptidase